MTPNLSGKLSYSSSGVNIAEGDKFVSSIKPLVKKTFSNSVIQGLGNFGAFYEIKKKFKSPVFVSSIDGVGTKLKLASYLNRYETVGEDLVNHCVNDIAVCGAVPLFFLDYYASGKLNSLNASKVIEGMVRGCISNNCSLIGGETAEMPGLYSGNDFDLAGCITGIVEKKKIIDRKNVKKGDLLIGLPSNGLHTNGYSLARKIFDTKAKLNKKLDHKKITVADELLKVHRSYLDIIQSSLKKYKINSISHITGGGIEGNTDRVIPAGRKLLIDWCSWEKPEIFRLIKVKGNVSDKVMRQTFNMGLGLIFIVSPGIADKFIKFLWSKNEMPVIAGEVK
ncbi:phosphoribosylformylglycinamidine cyclo-ligase [soil metagenome]